MNSYSMQINVPHSKYGNCEWFIPEIIRHWLAVHGLDPQYCGGGTWGNGFTNGVTNHESIYMVRDVKEIDATAFKIQFPECRVHLCKQFRNVLA